ncbi:MAG: hypothetical protein K9J48_03220 [Desulfohalobiaceae bacterium]|nr:hypothetical protein [Desulfohalobiaceae bacterium]
MKKGLMLLMALAAVGLLVSQAAAWWGPQMGYGPAYTATQAPGANKDVANLRADIASTRAELSRELAKDKVNMDKVRQLNQEIAQKRQELRSTANRRGTRGYGARGYDGGGYGYHHGGHMAGYAPCW